MGGVFPVHLHKLLLHDQNRNYFKNKSYNLKNNLKSTKFKNHSGYANITLIRKNLTSLRKKAKMITESYDKLFRVLIDLNFTIYILFNTLSI